MIAVNQTTLVAKAASASAMTESPELEHVLMRCDNAACKVCQIDPKTIEELMTPEGGDA